MAKNVNIVPQPTGSTLPYILFENTNGDVMSLNVKDDGTLVFSGATHGDNLVTIDSDRVNIKGSIHMGNDIGFNGIMSITDSGGWKGSGVGLKGNKGNLGDDGLKGLQGPIGPVANKGATLKGPTGDKGRKGLKGIKGIEGTIGDSRIFQNDGDKGLKGKQGLTSTDKGSTGEKGNIGVKGEAGQQGPIGVQAPEGPSFLD